MQTFEVIGRRTVGVMPQTMTRFYRCATMDEAMAKFRVDFPGYIVLTCMSCPSRADGADYAY